MNQLSFRKGQTSKSDLGKLLSSLLVDQVYVKLYQAKSKEYFIDGIGLCLKICFKLITHDGSSNDSHSHKLVGEFSFYSGPGHFYKDVLAKHSA